MKKVLAIFFVSLNWLMVPANVTAQSVFFVDAINGDDTNAGTTTNDAFKTIQKARDVVRTVNSNMTEDILIYLKDGIYELDTTLSLTYSDSGTNGHKIIYQAYNCAEAIISGGSSVSGWQLHDPIKNIYKAFVGPSIHSRQFYVNGLRAVRARSISSQGWTENGGGYDCPAEVASWGNITNVEVVSFMEWKCHRGPIATVSGSHATMAQPYWDNLHLQLDAPPEWVENAYELLDAKGEWYLDFSNDTIYYKPRDNEDMSTAETVLPRLETLVHCSNLSNVQFIGLKFAYATWLSPNSVNGFACAQADARIVDFQLEQMQGNVIFDHCSNIQISANTFEHLGTTGLQLFEGCHDNIIYNNIFSDISGSAISIGDVFNPFPSSQDLVANNRVENNLITQAANEFKGCVGIFVAYSENTVLSHNEIRNLPYSGISMGWGWSTLETVAKNNEISYNLIDSVMTELNDGGAIYTLSAQNGTEIHHNYIQNQLSEFGSLYPDQGSSHMHWHHNVVQDVVRWLHMWTGSVQYDTVDYNYYNNNVATINGSHNVIQNNVYVFDNNWPAGAMEIMNNAGREPAEGCVPILTQNEEIAVDVPSILIYPNPFDDILHFSFEISSPSSFDIAVYDTFGRLICKESKPPFQNQFNLSLKSLSSGLYLVQILSGQDFYTWKVIKK